MQEEITKEAIYLAVKKLGQQLLQMEKRLTAKIDSIGVCPDTTDKNSKQEFDKVHDRLDLMEAQMTIFAGNLSKTQAELMVLKNTK